MPTPEALQHIQITPSVLNVLESFGLRQRLLGLAKDALEQLRLDVKYLQFDLEATRRERDDFRAQLEK